MQCWLALRWHYVAIITLFPTIEINTKSMSIARLHSKHIPDDPGIVVVASS